MTPAPTGVPRLLPATADPSLGAHLQRLGALPPAGDLVAEVARSGLRGRGGAAFAVGTKMAAVAARDARIVVANGAEGEPASYKDKALLSLAPHLVLDGAVLAAAAVGAGEVVVLVDRAAPAAAAAVQRALAQRRDGLPVRLHALPHRYIAGEETALVHWLDGGEAKPTFTPPRPFERGILVQNVESLAHVALIARFGADWFRELGTPEDPGSTLVTLSGALSRRGVFEVPLGIALGELLGDVSAPLLVGGYFGVWLTAAEAAQSRLCRSDLAVHGAAVGTGVLSGLDPDTCGLAEAARITRWLAGQTAQQCGPCVFGLASIADALDRLVAGDRDGTAEAALHRWLAMVAGRGACKHPDGTARFVESSLRVFAAEVDAHRRHGPCGRGAGRLPTPPPEGWR